MKTIREQFIILARLLVVLILMQSCTVYRNASVSLEQASRTGNKVRVQTNSGEKFMFKRIQKEDQNYYGLLSLHECSNRVVLKPEFVKEVNEKDRTASTVLSIATPLLIELGYILFYRIAF